MATIRVNQTSPIVAMFVVALAAALLAGAAVGYLIRAVGAPLSISANSSSHPTTVSASAQLPASIEQYLRPAGAAPSAYDQLPASERQSLNR